MISVTECPFDLQSVLRRTFVQHVEYHAVLESTNTTAVELLEPLLDHSPSVVLALHQTAGRGRKGNPWWSGVGALTFSLVLDSSLVVLPDSQRSLLSLVAGLAVRTAVAETAPGSAIRIKWPNDILAGQAKISGILTEQHQLGGGSQPSRQGLVIGIGINVNNSLHSAPAEIRQRATSVFDLQHSSVDLTALLIRVLQELERRVQQCERQLTGLLVEANQWHVLGGLDVRVRVADHVVSGRCVGIDEDGRLVVADGTRVHRLSSGVVLDWTEQSRNQLMP